jgi:Zn-dependent peptidase ImmA (M78 family)
MPDLMSGVYSDSLNMIIIRSDQLDHQKRVAIAHELIHAERHDGGCAGIHSREETRTRITTALRLINRTEYALAEQLREGNVYDIACDLRITVQTVRDYQQWLDEHPHCERIAA